MTVSAHQTQERKESVNIKTDYRNLQNERMKIKCWETWNKVPYFCVRPWNGKIPEGKEIIRQEIFEVIIVKNFPKWVKDTNLQYKKSGIIWDQMREINDR